QILPGIECAFCTGFRMLIRCGVSEHHETRTRLLLHGEGDVIEAVLCLVIDPRRAASITFKGYMAEVLRFSNSRRPRDCERDLGICLRSLAKIVDDIACDSDRCRGKSGGLELCRWA